MKNLKRIIAIVCVSVFLICCFSFSASALVFVDGDFGFELKSSTKEATIVSYYGSDQVVTIPGNYDNYSVTKLGSNALSGNAEMQVLNLPTTMKKIENNSLSNCTALSSVRFPTYIISLGEYVCLNCTSLQTAYVYASINKLPDYSFAGCSSLTTVDLNNSITSIGAYAFQDCTSLSKINFLSGVSSIGIHSFENTAVKNITIPESIDTIPEYAFANCSSLEYMKIPKSVTAINSTAFYNDSNLVLGVYKDSYALQYAEENKIDHIVLDGDKIGDVNGDGAVDILDATEIQKYAAESTDFTDEQFELGDINKDGYCNVIDALLVQKSVIGAYEMPQNIIRY